MTRKRIQGKLNYLTKHFFYFLGLNVVIAKVVLSLPNARVFEHNENLQYCNFAQ